MQEFLERATLTAPVDAKTGKGVVQIIAPGWGNRFYSADVLAEAAAKKVFKAGTRMYTDHASESEKFERPERSVHDIAAVLTEDASAGADGALTAPIQVVKKYRESLAELAELGAIGCSISAGGFDEVGEAEGRQGQIVTSIDECKSVDFVTTPAAGGKILMLESDRAVLVEAAESDVRDALRAAITDAHAGDNGYAYVRDYDADASLVWFECSGNNGSMSGLYQQSYSTASNGSISLAGAPVEVRVKTTYVPVQPAGQSESQPPKEIPMGQIQIEEAEATRLRETAGLVPKLQTDLAEAVKERDAEKARADKAEASIEEAKAEKARTDKARSIITTEATKTGATFSALESKGLLAELPVDDKGALNETAFTEAVTAACTEALTRQSAGGVHGFGSREPFQFDESATVTDDDLKALDEAAFGPISQEA